MSIIKTMLRKDLKELTKIEKKKTRKFRNWSLRHNVRIRDKVMKYDKKQGKWVEIK